MASNGEDQFLRTSIPCPHCQSVMRIRSNRPINLTARELFFFCTNMEECGATYRAALTILNQVSPSGTPNPCVNLALSPPRKRPAPANDDSKRGSEVPPRANDNDELGEAVG
jgi:ssDNA-binding Zn-finger/Zn-ribbon topoisomerase 1